LNKLEQVVRESSPGIVGDLLIGLRNKSLYAGRHGGKYHSWRAYYEKHAVASSDKLLSLQKGRLRQFLAHCCKESLYYSSILRDIDLAGFLPEDLRNLPVLEKSDILNGLPAIATIDRSSAVVSMTGGTTGNSMEVLYHPEDMQERFAFVDMFRSVYGYELGKRVVWSTGKGILSRVDRMIGRYHKNDLFNDISFLSTFHLCDATFPNYWTALRKFKPEYLLGFPSFYYDLCTHAAKRGLVFSGVKTFFPTAETVTDSHRSLIRRVFDCEIVDQYASSEGAPFIVQCSSGKYHLQPHTGVFEVVDKNMQPSTSGELLVTSFSTRGTPLIRYRVGDSITLDTSGRDCACGFGGSIVASIDGRSTDFVVTPDGSKISSVNMSNATKEIVGIRRFQIVQDRPNKIDVFVEADNLFDSVEEMNFVAAIRDRVGGRISVSLNRVDNIPPEKSGKFRLVKRTFGDSS